MMAVANPVHAKAWTAAVGAGILTLIQILQFVSPFLPGQWSWIATGVIGVLTSVAVFFVPNQLTQEQVNHAVAKGNVSVSAIPGPATAWPQD